MCDFKEINNCPICKRNLLHEHNPQLFINQEEKTMEFNKEVALSLDTLVGMSQRHKDLQEQIIKSKQAFNLIAKEISKTLNDNEVSMIRESDGQAIFTKDNSSFLITFDEESMVVKDIKHLCWIA